MVPKYLHKSGQTIAGDMHRTQMICYKLIKKHSEYATRQKAVVMHHHSYRPHVRRLVKTVWHILYLPSYSLDLARSNLNLFSMLNDLPEKRFTSEWDFLSGFNRS